jgi:hypothetical protein
MVTEQITQDAIRKMLSVMTRAHRKRINFPNVEARAGYMRWIMEDWIGVPYSEELYELALEAVRRGVRVDAYEFPHPDDS